MDNQPSFNRDLIIPIFIGGLSIIGLLVALLIGRSLSSPPPVPMTPSPTPFEFMFLGTEPAIATPFVELSEVAEGPEIATLPEDPFGQPPASTPLSSPSFPTPDFPTPNFPTPPNRTPTVTALVLRTNTPGGGGFPPSDGSGPPTTIPTATLSTPGAADTYDDTNPRLAYTGSWVSQTNVPGAYQGTLHISNTIGDTVTFTFTGNEIHLSYQAGPSLGTVAITIDGAGPPPFSQAQNDTQIKEWTYEVDSDGTHAIIIQHFSGGSINIDSLRVPGPTPTPSRTFTPAQ
jgi:hypothetical protein